MVNLGYISFATESGGGYDSSGNPIVATKVWSSFIPCNIATITKEYKSLVEGQYRNAKFKILVDNRKLTGLDLSSLKEIKLMDSINTDLGVFQVQNRENLVLACQMKIVV